MNHFLRCERNAHHMRLSSTHYQLSRYRDTCDMYIIEVPCEGFHRTSGYTRVNQLMCHTNLGE